jgi:hypothetical protein
MKTGGAETMLSFGSSSAAVASSSFASAAAPALGAADLTAELYHVLDQIQQLVGYEEVPRSKLLALQASNMLKCSVYNHDDVLRIITTARSEFQRETATAAAASTAAGDGLATIEMLLGVVEFKLCAQTHLPDSETEALALIARFQRNRACTRTPGFFETIGNVVVEVCGKRGRRIQIVALSAELEQRLRSERKRIGGSGGSGGSGAAAGGVAAEGIANCAKCFRQLVEFEPDNVDRIRWIGKALEFAKTCGESSGASCGAIGTGRAIGSDRENGAGSTAAAVAAAAASSLSSSAALSSSGVFPLEELSWLAATAWNCGLACQKAGAPPAEAQHFLTLAIKLAQLRPGVVRADELESMLQWYAEEHDS